MRKFIILLCCSLLATGIQARKKDPVLHIPILGWYSIPPGEHATLEHYRETDDHVQLVRCDGSSAPAQRYDPLFILSPGNCEIFEVK